VVVAFDEFGPMELKPVAGTCWAQRRHPQRLRATYQRRAGTEQFLAFYDVHGDCLAGVVHRRKTALDLLAAWRRLRACYPKRLKIYLVLDNLRSHCTADLRDYAAANRIVLVYTPTYASWLNAIEAHFTPLKRFCIANSDDPDHLTRRRRIYRYCTWRNRQSERSRRCPLRLFRRY
jgi:transposase